MQIEGTIQPPNCVRSQYLHIRPRPALAVLGPGCFPFAGDGSHRGISGDVVHTAASVNCAQELPGAQGAVPTGVHVRA
jgi:hypothetical protein